MRVKKGLYVRNYGNTQEIPTKELLANLIYGPSYISLQYALSTYGMIPEVALQVSSITFKKTKRYRTPLGDFMYRSVPHPYYLRGIRLQTTEQGFSYLIATPEKALMDTLYFTNALRSLRDIRTFILEDLRMDKSSLAELDFLTIDEISSTARTPKLILCRKALEVFTQ